MTRIHLLSDLHIEHGEFTPPQVDADVTVLAGDVWTRARLMPWENAEEVFGHPVIMVAGNHEFYGDKIDTGLDKLREQARLRGVILLERDGVVVAGTRFLGCTLWTDFRLFAGGDMDQVRADAQACVGTRWSSRVNDFSHIRVANDGYRLFRPKDAAQIHERSVQWLRERLAEPFDGPTVVVTHHAPSALCVPSALMSDRHTAADASRLDGFIEDMGPDIWIWGHIHQAVPEFTIGGTRMLSNPRGYASEPNPRFVVDLVVEVGQPAMVPSAPGA
jgi:predicted phosphodiesterase